MSQFSTAELNLLLHAVDAYARTMNTREAHVGPACRLKDKLCDLGADYTGPIPEQSLNTADMKRAASRAQAQMQFEREGRG